MRAKLPKWMIEHTIGRMMSGTEGYTTPWGLWVDEDHNCWLHPDYPCKLRPGGTVSMLVKRDWDGSYAVRLDPSYKYKPSNTPGYISPADTKYIPVKRFLDECG